MRIEALKNASCKAWLVVPPSLAVICCGRTVRGASKPPCAVLSLGPRSAVSLVAAAQPRRAATQDSTCCTKARVNAAAAQAMLVRLLPTSCLGASGASGTALLLFRAGGGGDGLRKHSDNII